MHSDFVAIQRRLAETILTAEIVNADRVTVDGRFAVDHEHRPNARQSTIGAVFRWAAGLGLITPVDMPPLRSRSPRRKQGTVRQWRRTDTGIAWAVTFLEQTPAELQHVADVVEQLALFAEEV